MAASSRVWGRRVHAPQAAPDWVKDAAYVFAQAAPMPMGAGNRAPMRDLKGWLARLLAEDVLPRWVDAAAALCQVAEDERRIHSEFFTRTVLRAVSDRDHTRSQSVDTTLRRHCSTDPRKGLTFMKILKAICAAFDFARCTSRCEQEASRLVTPFVAERWRSRFDAVIDAFSAVRLCVKNDDASKELITSITNRTWAGTFAALLLKEVHRHCDMEPALLFSNRCTYAGGDSASERRDLASAIAEAVMCAAPHAIACERVLRSHFTSTMENDPICTAAMIMPHSPDFALTLADRAVGLIDRQSLNGSQIPFEVHREIRLFSHISRIAHTSELLSRIMIAFAPVFKCYRPPLRWRPTDEEIQFLHKLATNKHWIALTVIALIDEDEGHKKNSPQKNIEALNRYELSGECGDVFGATHAAKMLISGCPGIPRDPARAERFLLFAARNNIRVAISVLADLYCGMGEPDVPRNEVEAARLYNVAVDMGCSRAALGLAKLYKRGAGGLPKDEEKGNELERIAFALQQEKLQRYGREIKAETSVPLICAPKTENFSGICAPDVSSPAPSTAVAEVAPNVASACAPHPVEVPVSEASGVCVPQLETAQAQEELGSSMPVPELLSVPGLSEPYRSGPGVIAALDVSSHLSPDLCSNELTVSATCGIPLDDPLNMMPEVPKFSQVARLRLSGDTDMDDDMEFAVPLKRARYHAPEEGIGIGS